MICPLCKTPSDPGARVCLACRSEMPPNCAGCGAPTDEGEDLCRACRTDPAMLELDPSDVLDEELPDETFVEKADGHPSGRGAARSNAGQGITSPSLRSSLQDAGPVPLSAMAMAGAVDDAGGAAASDAVPLALAAGPLGEMQTAPTGAREKENFSPTAATSGPAGADPAPKSPAPPPREERPDLVDLTPRLVGRRDVLGSLIALVEKATKTRQVQLAALSGAPGTGKSLIARALPEAVAAMSPHALVLVASCGGPGAPPFAAFARMLRTRCGIAESDPPALARTRIVAQISESLPAARATEITHLVARLVGVPFPDSSVVDEFSERTLQLEARTFIAVRRFLGADAARRPLVLVFDDIERARPETVRLIRYLAAGLEGHPVVLLVVGRPSLFEEHPSLAQANAALERIELGPLTPAEAQEVFVALTRAAGEPPLALTRHASERLGGSPRAIVELVRYLLETGAIKKLGTRHTFDRMRFARLTLAGAPGTSMLPASLEELLAARLQALNPSLRELLEKAAACGEAFWLDALVAISRSASSSDPDGPSLEEIEAQGDRLSENVEAALAELAGMGLIEESPHARISGEREFYFAYPPWWDVVYKTLSAPARRRYHKLVAQWLELRPEGRGDAEQEEVGLHLETAGDGDGAALRYRRAGDGARKRYYNDEAIRLYRRALGCVGENDLATRINLFHDLGSVCHLKGEHEPARHAFERMLRLAWLVASRSKAAVAWNKLGRLDRQLGELRRALSNFERGLALFTQVDDERGVSGCLDDIAQVLWLLGRYDEALERGAMALERRRKLGEQHSVALSLLTIGHIERHRGLFQEADSCYREALAIRRALDDRAGIAASLNGLGALSFQRGDYEGARGHWDEALGLAEEVGALPLVAVLEAHLGEVARVRGNIGEARSRFERSLAAARDLDDKRLLSEALRNLSVLELANAELDRARALAQESLELAESAGIRVDVGRALIALGEVHAQTLFHDQGEGGEGAEDFFRRAVELFREIGNTAELGVSLERFGTWYIERGELDRGKAFITEAEEIFRRLGMKAYGDAARRIMTELE